MKLKGSVTKQEAEVEISSEEARDFLDLIVPKSARELGGIIYDNVKLWRYKNQVKILEKASKFAAEHNLDVSNVNLKVLVPLLENASLEEEEALQDKWAAMLGNAASGQMTIRPLFPEILKELSSTEVLVLDKMYEAFDSKKDPALHFNKQKIGELFQIQKDELDLIIDNFLRLGLCRTPGNKGVSFGDIPVAMHTTELFEFTSLGVQFVSACRFIPKR